MKLTWGHNMRIYKVSYTVHDVPVVEWFHRQDEAESLVAEAPASSGASMQIIEIPASRLGIVAWLNENYTREI